MAGAKSGGTSRDRSVRLRIGANLTALRIASGKSREDCADAVGTTRWSWIRWEEGGAIPLEKLPLICRVLSATTDQIFPPGARPPVATTTNRRAA